MVYDWITSFELKWYYKYLFLEPVIFVSVRQNELDEILLVVNNLMPMELLIYKSSACDWTCFLGSILVLLEEFNDLHNHKISFKNASVKKDFWLWHKNLFQKLETHD